MLQACKNGEIDMIITKSISRFARNSTIILETIREFEAIGVDIYFHEQGCNGPVTHAIDEIEEHINKQAHK